MASPSVTYSFTNGTTADATQVNQNFTDLINGITDGTKDLSISALTCAGTATLNGAVNLGNASADDISVNGSVATAIVPKTTATYALGSSAIGWSYLYLGGSTYVVGLLASGSTTASYNLTLPTATGAAGTGMITNGSGVLSWKPLAVDTSAKAADYVITDGDGLRTILVTTGASDRDVTLPTASVNTHRIITVKKVDSGVGIVTVKSDAAGETIDGISGTAGIAMPSQYDTLTVHCDGSDWHVIDSKIAVSAKYFLTSGTSDTTPWGGGQTSIIDFDSKSYDTHSAVTTGAAWKYTAPVAGVYAVSCSFNFTYGSGEANSDAIITSVYKGGSEVNRLSTLSVINATVETAITPSGATTVKLAAGEYIDIRCLQQTGTDAALNTTANRHFISIDKIN